MVVPDGMLKASACEVSGTIGGATAEGYSLNLLLIGTSQILFGSGSNIKAPVFIVSWAER